MRRIRLLLAIIAVATLLPFADRVVADEVHAAVASNFAETARIIAARYRERTGHDVVLSTGSTGKHYAQIRNGAPFDIFFAADSERPELLEQQGISLPQSRFTYALGRLVLWSPQPHLVDADGEILNRLGKARLAIANPRLAPYGRAAQQVLQARGAWQALQGRLVRGENIGQTFQFVHSGNAALGFIALSQIKRPGQAITGSLWEVPETLHSPIAQQAVQLREGEAARGFLAFLRSEESLQTIREYGYGVPDAE